MIREAAVEESITVYSVQKNLLLAPPAPINKIQQRYAVQLIRLSTAKNGCKLIARVYDKKFFLKTQNKVKLEVKKTQIPHSNPIKEAIFESHLFLSDQQKISKG